MNLHLEPIVSGNRSEVEQLCVAPEQRGYIETVTECMLEADGLEYWNPVGIYDQAKPVGFAMYGFFPEEGKDGRLWMDRLLIDHNSQGKGYGRISMGLLLSRLEQEYGIRDIYLSLYEGNLAAERLYGQFGFVRNGEIDLHGEQVMVRVPAR